MAFSLQSDCSPGERCTCHTFLILQPISTSPRLRSSRPDARSFTKHRRFSLGAHYRLRGKRTVAMVPADTLAPRVRYIPLPSTITPQKSCVDTYGAVAVSSRLALAGLTRAGLQGCRSGRQPQVCRSGRPYKGNVKYEACCLSRFLQASNPHLQAKPCLTAGTCPTWTLVSSPPRARNLRLLRPTLLTAPVAVARNLAPSMARSLT